MKLSKTKLLHQLNGLKMVLEKDAEHHFLSLNLSIEKIMVMVQKAIEHVDGLSLDIVEYNYSQTIDELSQELVIYLKNTTVPVSVEWKAICGKWYNKILRILEYCISIPDKKNDLRSVSEKTLRQELNRVISQRDFIDNQIEIERKANPQSPMLPDLEANKKELEERISLLRNGMRESSNTDMVEKDWNKRITDSFDYLSIQTRHINERRASLDAEYHLFLYALPLWALLLVCWYCHLYGCLQGYNDPLIDNYFKLVPYYIPIPVIIALFWVCIIQKNRASRMLIAIDEELFRINYLQGLLLATNRLSSTPQDAIKRINEALDAMTASYLHQTETNNMTEKIQHIDSVKGELNEVITTLKELINIMKHER